MDFHELLAKAQEASQFAYVPYSKFKVGAALLTKSGEIFTGSNVENSSYGLTICAERVAVFKAISAGYQDFRAIAIYGTTEEPISPCGACRQVLREFGEDIIVVMGNKEKKHKIKRIEELLPDSFILKMQEEI